VSHEAGLIGEHPSLLAVRRLIARVAASSARAVLIYGETGTGKGVAARMIHQQSARARQEFVDVNCAAIPDALLESELFGHEKGAFTGAVARKTGLVEIADKGTIFLDEIRDMNLVMQAKLLALLDTQRFRRVGAVKPMEVDVRFIAATNRILLSEVKGDRFREDLYYRLQVIAINLPPLRDRGEDVFVLTEHFLRKFAARHGRVIRGLEPAVEDIFRRYPWPGNVRELENLLERIVILEDEDIVRVAHLPARIPRQSALATPPGDAADYHAATEAFQRALIRTALDAAAGNPGDAARRLGLSRHALRHQMLKLNMRAP